MEARAAPVEVSRDRRVGAGRLEQFERGCPDGMKCARTRCDATSSGARPRARARRDRTRAPRRCPRRRCRRDRGRLSSRIRVQGDPRIGAGGASPRPARSSARRRVADRSRQLAIRRRSRVQLVRRQRPSTCSQDTAAPAARAGGARAARGAGAVPLADRARNWPIAPTARRLPSPVVASVFSIGGRHSPGRERLQRQVRGDRLHQPVGALPIGLVDDEDVGDLHDARLDRLHSSPVPGTSTTIEMSAVRDDVHFVLADADRLDDDDVLAGGSSTSATSPVARARPPRWPRVAMLRMNTPASRACAPIRTRSPSTAPPVNGLVGSTAMTPTVGRPSRGSRRSADRPACSCPRRAGR